MSDPDPVKLAQFLVFSSLLVLAFNSTLLYIFKRYSLPASPSNILVINLSICDLLAVAFNIPFFIQIALNPYNDISWNWLATNPTLCNINGVANQLLATQSVLTIFLLALERYLMICTFKRMTKKMTINILITTWAISIGLSIKVIFYTPAYVLQPSGIYCMEDLTATSWHHVTLRAILAAGLNLILLFLFYSHYMISTEIRRCKASNNRKTSHASHFQIVKRPARNFMLRFGNLKSKNEGKASKQRMPEISNNTETRKIYPTLGFDDGYESLATDNTVRLANNHSVEPVGPRVAATQQRQPNLHAVDFYNSPQPVTSPILIATIDDTHDSSPQNDDTVIPSSNAIVPVNAPRAVYSPYPNGPTYAVDIPNFCAMNIPGQAALPRKKSPAGSCGAKPLQSALEKMLIKRAVYICLAFTISWSFYNYALLHSLITNGQNVGSWIDSLAMWGVAMNCVLNPILTFVLDKRFRRGLEETVMALW
ncbi:hypothetical protein BKA69DRAFT_1057360 [Paraphysoderma sedebokerense]|nr:hypothetical protein BKA69DRAFT_1057360 [Paraphysoderma sedebokerense]